MLFLFIDELMLQFVPIYKKLFKLELYLRASERNASNESQNCFNFCELTVTFQ